jgi:hypothetical protein
MSLARLSLILPFAILTACGDKDPADDTGAGTGGGEADTDTDADADTDTDTDTDTPTATLSGSVQMPDGSPASVQMRLCYHVCIPVDTDASGNFSFSGAEGDVTHTLQAVTLGDTSYAVPNSLLSLAADEERTLSAPLVVHPFATKEGLSGAATVVGDGITIEADAAGYVAGIYTPDLDNTFVATVEVDPTSAGLPADGMPGTPIAMWYLGNFDAEIDPGWAFSTSSTYGLAEGAKVDAYVLDNIGKEWLGAGTATVAGERIVSDAGAGLPRLTTLILVPQ